MDQHPNHQECDETNWTPPRSRWDFSKSTLVSIPVHRHRAPPTPHVLRRACRDIGRWHESSFVRTMQWLGESFRESNAHISIKTRARLETPHTYVFFIM